MSAFEQQTEVLKLMDGLRFSAGPDYWTLEPLKLSAGAWMAMTPGGDEPVVDPSGKLAFILATMAEPIRGNVALFGQDVYRLDYSDRLRLRARIGFVHGYGGLISNLTVRENIALPVSVHGKMTTADKVARADQILKRFALEKVANLQPHRMDGATRWRACLARALVLEPEWLVLEGLGNWEMDRGRSKGWTCLLEQQSKGRMATAICLPRQNPEFESWFKELNGEVVCYTRLEDRPKGEENR